MGRTATSSEVAAALGVSSATIQRYAREGKIRYDETAGKHRRFDIEEVRHALKNAERPRASVVVLTALQCEFNAVVEQFDVEDVVRLDNGTRYTRGHVEGQAIDWSVYVAEIGEGNVTAAAEATRAIQEFNPTLLYFVGVAGSLKSDVVHGTVVVANKVYRYHGGKDAEDFYARPMTFPTLNGLEQLVRHVRSTHWSGSSSRPIVELKAIAAGEVVVGSKRSSTFALLRKNYNDAVAVDMESVGLYEAAHRAGGKPVLAIRGISDMLDDKSPEEDADWQPTASRHAAEFAFALLRAADPGDLNLQPAFSPVTSEREELLSRIPPPVAQEVEKLLSLPIGMRLLRTLADSESSPSQNTGAAFELAVDVLAKADQANFWSTVGEFASSHGLAAQAADAYARAASLSEHRAIPLARQAWAKAKDESAKSDLIEIFSEARAAAIDDNERSLVDVLSAAATEDVPQLLLACEAATGDHVLVDILHVVALANLGREDEARDLADKLLRDRPGRFVGGRLPLLASHLLTSLSVESDAGEDTVGNLSRAIQLALEVYEVRRAWGGPSEEAIEAAVAAAVELGDFALIYRLTLPPPEGEANKREAAVDNLAIIAANAALKELKPEKALKLSGRIKDTAERLFVQAGHALLTGADAAKVKRLLRAALDEATTHDQRQRILTLLADHDLIADEELRLIEASSSEDAEIIRAHVDVGKGDLQAAERRLRQLDSIKSLRMLVGVYVKHDRIDDAADILRTIASRYRQPRYSLDVADLLASVGRYDEALAEATTLIAKLPPGALHAQVRLLAMRCAHRAGDWDALVTHGREALREGLVRDDSKWAIVVGLVNDHRYKQAFRELSSLDVRIRSEEEAMIAMQLLRREGDQSHASVTRILEIAEQFADSEQVSGVALMHVLQMGRDAELPADAATKLARHSEYFFERWPESDIVKQIDVSDIDNLTALLRQQFGGEVQEQEETILRGSQSGQYPYALLPAARGRTVLETLISRTIGQPLPVGTPDDLVRKIQLDAAKASVESRVIIDSTALLVLEYLEHLAPRLTGLFPVVLAAEATFEDALQAQASLSLRSTATLGYDRQQDRPVVSEIPEELATRRHELANGVVGRLRRLRLASSKQSRPDRRRTPDAVLGPFELARELKIPLWTDDAAIRVMAANEGVAAFGTSDLLAIARDLGVIDAEDHKFALVSLVANACVDLPLDVEIVLRASEKDEWSGVAASIALSRPISWRRPQDALQVLKQCVSQNAVEQVAELMTHGATLGVAKSVVKPMLLRSVASVILSALFATEAGGTLLPAIVRGARSALVDFGGDDPLVQVAGLLQETLSEDVDEADVGPILMNLMTYMDDRDRAIVFEHLIRSDRKSH